MNLKSFIFATLSVILWTEYSLSSTLKIDDIDTILKNNNPKIKAYDPAAMENCEKLYSDQSNLSFCKHKDQALEGSDALIVATEWKAFRSPDFSKMKRLLKSPVIFDGRNLYDPAELEQLGFSYYAIGRGKKTHT